MSPRAACGILLDAVDPRAFRLFGADLDGVRLCADDLDRSFGIGTPLRGRAQGLLLVAYGRRLPPGHLDGEDCHRFVAA